VPNADTIHASFTTQTPRGSRRNLAAAPGLRVLVASLAAAGGGGCAAVPLAMIGTALGVVGSAASVGGTVFSQGKLDSAELATADQWAAAVRAAAAELCMSVAETPPTAVDGTRTFTLTDDHKSAVDVRVEPRTRTMVRSRVDVGLFGSEPTARLILARIRHQAGTPEEAAPGERGK
jgi:hypothetical protein